METQIQIHRGWNTWWLLEKSGVNRYNSFCSWRTLGRRKPNCRLSCIAWILFCSTSPGGCWLWASFADRLIFTWNVFLLFGNVGLFKSSREASRFVQMEKNWGNLIRRRRRANKWSRLTNLQLGRRLKKIKKCFVFAVLHCLDKLAKFEMLAM